MRGKGKFTSGRCIAPGITPAYAGKSTLARAQALRCRDHPRICGEKGVYFRAMHRPWGSPPHMRGKALSSPAAYRLRRITPAYAGKSRWHCRTNRATGDHPRICGEKLVKGGLTLANTGSPPHMRGKVRKPHGSERQHRITPAYAGKSPVT